MKFDFKTSTIGPPCKKYQTKCFTDSGVEIGNGFIIIDYKEEGKPSGIIENIYVDDNFRKNGLGGDIVNKLISMAKEHGCYKITLDCADHNVHFYEELGFEKHQNGMRISL